MFVCFSFGLFVLCVGFVCLFLFCSIWLFLCLCLFVLLMLSLVWLMCFYVFVSYSVSDFFGEVDILVSCVLLGAVRLNLHGDLYHCPVCLCVACLVCFVCFC